MIESTENPSLFKDDEIPRKASGQTTRRKTTKASKASVGEAASEGAPASAPKTTRARAAASTQEEPQEPVKAKAARAPRAAKGTKAAKAAPSPEVEVQEAASAPAPRKRAVRKAPVQEEESPLPVAPSTEVPVAAEKPAVKKTRAPRGAKARPQPPGPVVQPEEWKPGAAASAPPAPEVQPAPAAPEPSAPVSPVAPVSPAKPVEQAAPGAPSAPAQRPPENREPAQQGGRGGREGRDHRNFRRDRDFRGRRDFREREHREHREHREYRDYRENAESREQRIAAARQEFAAQPAPEGASGGQEGVRAEPVFAEGIVEVSGKGFGFLRDAKRNFAQHPNDIFVTPEVCRRYTLRDGMWIRGEIRRGNRGSQLYKLTSIEGEDPEKFRVIPMFEELTTINPNRVIKLETVPDRYTTRVIDLMAPIGRGQRGLIVAPPRTGKTTLLQHIAEAMVKNHPDMKLIILLVDERPEEVTEIRRTVPGAEVMASSNDMDLKSHTRIAQLAIERAKRLVEMGKHVFVLLDSITRVGRAFNNAMGGGGRTMSGGVDARALEIPRKLFAAARNTEEAGSLTIIATALIETGSRMDDLIFQEFKGTGNMELVLDRKVSDLRIYPAVDIFQSGTRREELLLPESDLHKINIIRRGLAGHKPAEAIERLLSFLRKFPTNAQMLREIPG